MASTRRSKSPPKPSPNCPNLRAKVTRLADTAPSEPSQIAECGPTEARTAVLHNGPAARAGPREWTDQAWAPRSPQGRTHPITAPIISATAAALAPHNGPGAARGNRGSRQARSGPANGPMRDLMNPTKIPQDTCYGLSSEVTRCEQLESKIVAITTKMVPLQRSVRGSSSVF
jgi:hypothetical protein